jgi:hypothetical protein
MAFLFSQNPTVEIHLADANKRATVEIQRENGKKDSLFLFVGNETVKGSVDIEPPSMKKIEHKGVKIELIGQIGRFL